MPRDFSLEPRQEAGGTGLRLRYQCQMQQWPMLTLSIVLPKLPSLSHPAFYWPSPLHSNSRWGWHDPLPTYASYLRSVRRRLISVYS